jgi:triacylglycerol lipase
MARCHVYLVPGFFGFTSLGSLSYFHRVSETLEVLLDRRGLAAAVIECPTSPSGSIRHRAERLLEHVAATGGLAADELHFVGHSTGGLDLRLLLSPAVRLAPRGLPAHAAAELARRTRTVTTVATPHHGTPLADFFTLIPGRQLLQWLSQALTSRLGRLAVVGLGRAVGLAGRIDAHLRRETLLDALSRNLLQHLTLRSDDPVFAFLDQVSVDQAAIVQITPECMDLFNAAVIPDPEVAYGCVVTGTPAPPLSWTPEDLASPEHMAMGGLFLGAWLLTAREHQRYPYPMPPPEVLAELERTLENPHSPATNDGIVPTRSQLYGDLLAAVLADHYDVIGQFATPESALRDWLPSGSRFDAARFEAVWGCVADRIAGLDASRHAARERREARPDAAARPA